MNVEYTKSDLSMTSTEKDSVINSMSTIAGTPYASAPYIRGMGIKSYPPESNSEIARNQYAAEVITQCGIWENRAKVSGVYFEKDNNVRLVIENG